MQFSNTTYKNIYETIRKIHKRLLTLYNIDANDNTEKTNNNLEILLEFETILHFSNTKHRNKRKNIINNLIKNTALTSYSEVEAFFLPYFTNNCFSFDSNDYFVEFHQKLSDFLAFYRCLSKEVKELPTFQYVKDDLKLFIQCIYTREPLPERDYKKKYAQLIEP